MKCSLNTKRKVGTVILLVTLSVLSGCNTTGVEPWERDVLAKQEMQTGGDPVEAATDDHIYFSKEATSGDARRFILNNGVRYSHILNPMTGWPIKDAPHSITVLSDTCTQAGMLATLAMLKGTQAEEYLDSQAIVYWCQR